MVAKRKKRRHKLRVAYANQGNASDQRALDDLELAFKLGCDVVALSEHADRVDVTTKFCKLHPEYDQYYGDGTAGAAKECLVYKKSIGEVDLKKTIVLVKARKLAPGAGPEKATNKCALRVRARRGKRRINLIVAHQYATVHRRKEAAWLFMNALVDLVRARMGLVIFFGDLNETPGKALIRALRVLFTGSSSDTTGPTHHRRLIDYIMVKGGTILGAFTRKISSDHDMVVVDILF